MIAAPPAAGAPLLSPGSIALYQGYFPGLPLFCGRENDIGIPEVGQWADWTIHPTTEGQLRIETYLREAALMAGSALHIGIGNSSFAAEHHARMALIVGTSVLPNEVGHAQALGLPNYVPALLNKYSLVFALCFSAQFDLIIDNNPTTFGCCFTHLALMLRAYRQALRPGGLLLTEQRGLGFKDASNPRHYRCLPNCGQRIKSGWPSI